MLNDNIIKVKENIKRCGWHNVTIVAATKTVPSETIELLPSLGVTIAGENRVQELLSKYEHVNGITWHFIGRLQTNKVKYIVDKVELIQSVDSIKLADEIERRCGAIGKRMDVLVELNDGEETKGGVSESGLFPLCEHIISLPHLRFKGIMCVMPKDASEKMYEHLFELSQEVKSRFAGADELSLGMSGDYEMAVKHGATIVRLGSCLFGQRAYDKKFDNDRGEL